MEPTVNPRLSREEFIAQARKRMEEALGQVADAINEAPPGYLISGSERQVFNVFAKLKEEVYELGLQMRVDASEAAFPPSGGPGEAEKEAQ